MTEIARLRTHCYMTVIAFEAVMEAIHDTYAMTN